MASDPNASQNVIAMKQAAVESDKWNLVRDARAYGVEPAALVRETRKMWIAFRDAHLTGPLSPAHKKRGALLYAMQLFYDRAYQKAHPAARDVARAVKRPQRVARKTRANVMPIVSSSLRGKARKLAEQLVDELAKEA